MLDKIKTTLIIVLIICLIVLSGVSMKYYTNKLVYDGISFDAKRNQISADASIISSNDLLSDQSIKWAKRTVTFTFNTGVEEYLIGINTNGYLVTKKIR